MGRTSSTKTGTSSRASSEAPSVVARSETPTAAGQQEKFEIAEDVDTLPRKFHDFTLADELQSHSMFSFNSKDMALR